MVETVTIPVAFTDWQLDSWQLDSLNVVTEMWLITHRRDVSPVEALLKAISTYVATHEAEMREKYNDDVFGPRQIAEHTQYLADFGIFSMEKMDFEQAQLDSMNVYIEPLEGDYEDW